MAKEKKNSLQQDSTGMTFTINFVLVAIVNMLVISLANAWFPENVVLGTDIISTNWALALSSATLSLSTVLFLPFFKEWEKRRGKQLSPIEWLVGYFFVNFVSVWLLARKSELFGLGVTSWFVALALGFTLNMVQGMVMMFLEKKGGK